MAQDAAGRGRRGNTLVEVAVSMLLTAIIASSIFSVALTSSRGGGKSLRKLIADQASRQVAELLKNYVGGDISQPTPIIYGPGERTTFAESWYLTNDSLPATEQIVDACPSGGSSCWALQAGSHTVTGLMPKWFEGAPYNARVKYFVADHQVAPGSQGTIKSVSITVDWTEI